MGCFFQDPRFNRQIDGKTGYKTDSLVCMPVCNYDGEVIGVAQIINKKGGEEDKQFTDKDLKVRSDQGFSLKIIPTIQFHLKIMLTSIVFLFCFFLLLREDF